MNLKTPGVGKPCAALYYYIILFFEIPLKRCFESRSDTLSESLGSVMVRASDSSQGHDMFHAALQNVSKSFGEPTGGAAGLSRERIGMRSHEAAADRAQHFAPVEPRPYPSARSVMEEILFGRTSTIGPTTTPATIEGAAGRPVQPMSHPAMSHLGRPSNEPPCASSSVDCVNFGGLPPPYSAAAPVETRVRVAQGNLRAHGAVDSGRSASVSDRKVFLGAELAAHRDPREEMVRPVWEPPAPTQQMTPQGPEVSLFPSQWAEMRAGGGGTSADAEQPRSGVRVLAYQPTPRRATGRASGSCHPQEHTAEVRAMPSERIPPECTPHERPPHERTSARTHERT